MQGPIDSGYYRARGGQLVEIFETGSFAYGRVAGEDCDDFWQLDDGEYCALGLAPEGTAHYLDLIERIGDRALSGTVAS